MNKTWKSFIRKCWTNSAVAAVNQAWETAQSLKTKLLIRVWGRILARVRACVLIGVAREHSLAVLSVWGSWNVRKPEPNWSIMFAHLWKMKSWRWGLEMKSWFDSMGGFTLFFLRRRAAAVLDLHLLSNRGQIASWPGRGSTVTSGSHVRPHVTTPPWTWQRRMHFGELKRWLMRTNAITADAYDAKTQQHRSASHVLLHR